MSVHCMASIYIPVGCGGPLLCSTDRHLYVHHLQSMLLITLTQHCSNTVASLVCMSLYLSMGFIAEGIFVNCFDLFVHTCTYLYIPGVRAIMC